MRIVKTLLLCAFMGLCVSCAETHLKNALDYACANSPELETVLDHYKDSPEKLAAARFLIDDDGSTEWW